MDTAKSNFSWFLQNELTISTKETLKIGSREAENGNAPDADKIEASCR
jgi:hypothetical protein